MWPDNNFMAQKVHAPLYISENQPAETLSNLAISGWKLSFTGVKNLMKLIETC